MALPDEFLKIGYDIIGAAFEVRNNSGSMFREVYYQKALAWELRQRGYKVECEVAIPALYKGQEITNAYLADLIVDERVVIEVKAVSKMTESEFRQLSTYLKLSNFKLGYLINFGAQKFTTGKITENYQHNCGIYRIVNGI